MHGSVKRPKRTHAISVEITEFAENRTTARTIGSAETKSWWNTKIKTGKPPILV